jgi:queuosine precursor transporter
MKINDELKDRYSMFFLLIASIFATCIIIANIIAVKIVSIFNLIIPAAVIIFPISYICGDVLTEVYGYKNARKVILLAFFCNLIAVIAIWLGKLLPSAPFWYDQESYIKILGNSPRILIASFIAYLVGEFVNSYVLAILKIKTKGKWLWVRTIGSTIVGEGVDSLLFLTIAFCGLIPSSGLFNAILTQWVFKTLYETLATPLTYLIIGKLKKAERIEIFDDQTNFNPLVFK